MSIRVIAFGMVAILIGLFLLLRLFEKRLKEQSKKEAKYAEIVFHYQSQKDDRALEICLQDIAKLYQIDAKQAKELLISDGVLPNN